MGKGLPSYDNRRHVVHLLTFRRLLQEKSVRFFWGNPLPQVRCGYTRTRKQYLGGRHIAYIFNAPYAVAGKYTIVGEFSSSPYPAPDGSDNWYRGRCSVTREWSPQYLHAVEKNSLCDNYVYDFYASLGEGSLAQGVKSLYWTHSVGVIKAGAQMVVYGVKA